MFSAESLSVRCVVGEALEVHREDLSQIDIVITEVPDLAEGEVLVSVDSFAVTANNVTYAAMGTAMKYFDFFPASQPDRGVVPVWGFGTVVDSSRDELEVGQRLYGYFPMASHVILRPGRIDATGCSDGALHRRPMSGVYNRYQFVDADSSLRTEAIEMLLQPLHTTGFLLADAAAERCSGVPGSIVVSSASSKTAFATAHAARAHGMATIGLTSRVNLDAVRSTGLWDEVIDYDQLPEWTPSDTAGVYVDLAGTPSITAAIHRRMGDALRASLIVGATHHDRLADPPEALVGPDREFFFAPDRIVQRHRDWGRDAYEARRADAWADFARWAEATIELHPHIGPSAIAHLWSRVLRGSVDPREGHIARWGDQVTMR